MQSPEFLELISYLQSTKKEVEQIFKHMHEQSKQDALSIHPLSYINSLFHMTANRLFSANTIRMEKDLYSLFLGYTQFWFKNKRRTPLFIYHENVSVA